MLTRTNSKSKNNILLISRIIDKIRVRGYRLKYNWYIYYLKKILFSIF